MGHERIRVRITLVHIPHPSTQLQLGYGSPVHPEVESGVGDIARRVACQRSSACKKCIVLRVYKRSIEIDTQVLQRIDAESNFQAVGTLLPDLCVDGSAGHTRDQVFFFDVKPGQRIFRAAIHELLLEVHVEATRAEEGHLVRKHMS